jgi:protease I
VRGRHLTSWPSLATDYRNAGATWTDEELVVDNEGPFALISSRKPADLPAFCGELVGQLDKV